MSVNRFEIRQPLLLLAEPDWQQAMRGAFSATPVIFDLRPEEDGETSPEALRTLVRYLSQRPIPSATCATLLRIGGMKDGHAERDLASLENTLPDGILLSGSRNSADIQKLDVLLSVAEARKGVAAGSTAILAECGAEPEFFLSPHSLKERSARLCGLVLNGNALGRATGSQANTLQAGRTTDSLSFARAVCVLKAAEAQIPCYDLVAPDMPAADVAMARATCKANGFADIVARTPAQRAAPATPPAFD